MTHDNLAIMVTYFQRHTVPVFLLLERRGELRPHVFTTFVASVRDIWILVTAGHCITDVEEAARQGYTIKRARLLDSAGPDATYRESVPFDYEASEPIAPFADDKFDCGFLRLNPLDRAALAANGVVPITEDAWEKQCVGPEIFAATGFLQERSTIEPEKYKLSMVLLPIGALPERPHQFEETDAPRWYGQVSSHVAHSLVGMSGGPVLAFQEDSAGAVRYWLHGIQSAQAPRFPRDPYIAACLAWPMLSLIAERIDRQVAEQRQSAASAEEDTR